MMNNIKYRTIIIVAFVVISLIVHDYFFLGSRVSAALPEPVNSQQSYIAWLNATGRPAYSRYRGLAANYEVYRKYNLLSYGTHSNVAGNRYDAASKQYEAHGFSYDEYILYNSFFPEDFVSVTDPRTWNRINLGTDAAVSWMRLTLREKNHIKNAPMFYMGKSYNGINYTNLGLTESKCVVIAVPSMDLGFAVHTNHLASNGTIRYATFHGNGIGDYSIVKSLKAKNEPAGKKFIMRGDKNYIDIQFIAQMSINSYIGLAVPADIQGGKITFNNLEHYKSGSGPWEFQRTIRYHRTNHTSLTISRQITQKAGMLVFSAMGDVKSTEGVYSFSISEEPLHSNTLNATMSMKGEISAFRGDNSLLYNNLPINEMRFLCLEKVTLRIDFENSALPSNVTFFPVGGSPVSRAVTVTGPNRGYAEHKYTMAIVLSTLDWENKRIRTPYNAFAYMSIDGQPKYILLEGIEITGSIHDLVYIQAKIRN